MEPLQGRWEADEEGCWAHRRVHVYRLLSTGFGPPSPFLHHLVSSTQFLGHLRQALDASPEIFREPVEELGRFFRARDPARAVEQAYDGLFPRHVSPRGSDHGGPSPRKVRAFYRDAGMPLLVSPLPADHISVETAFLSGLAEREMWLLRSGRSQEARDAAEWSRRFLDGHVAPWVSRFALQVETRSASPFYGALAEILGRWVVLELDSGLRPLAAPHAPFPGAVSGHPFRSQAMTRAAKERPPTKAKPGP